MKLKLIIIGAVIVSQIFYIKYVCIPHDKIYKQNITQVIHTNLPPGFKFITNQFGAVATAYSICNQPLTTTSSELMETRQQWIERAWDQYDYIHSFDTNVWK